MRKLRLREGNCSHKEKEVGEQAWEVCRGYVVGHMMGHESPGHGHLVL